MSKVRRFGVGHALIDMSGQKIGKLTVLKRGINKGNAAMWECKCDCGEIVFVRGNHLRNGQKQCHKCTPRNHNITHGLHNHPLYTTWSMMKQRCENEYAVGYENYGGRGVKVCERWHKFELFVEDVGLPPSKNYTLDRIDFNGDYEPSNFRWATNKEQMRNKRNNRRIEFNGEFKTVSEWAEIYNMASETIFSRLSLGWSVKEIFSTKIREVERLFYYNGQLLPLKEWSNKLGISLGTLNGRIYKGRPLNEVFSITKFKTGKCRIK